MRPTPFATATSSSRNRRSRWTSYIPATRYAIVARITIIGRLMRYRVKSGCTSGSNGIKPVPNRTQYDASHATAVRARSQTTNQAVSD